MEHVAIPLGDYHTALIDAADEERVTAYPWHHKMIGNNVHAVRFMQWRGMWSVQTLEAFVLGLDAPGAPVRFIDGNSLHCWRDNLTGL